MDSLPPGSPTLSRRRLFALGATTAASAAAAGTALAHEAPAGAREDPAVPYVAGRVEERGDTHLVVRSNAGDSTVRVDVGPDAVVLRDGRARLADFSPGDQVACEGAWAERGVLSATHVELLFHMVETIVEERTGAVLRTRDGAVRLTPSTERMRGGHALGHDLRDSAPADIGAGDAIIICGARARDADVLVAHSVGVIHSR